MKLLLLFTLLLKLTLGFTEHSVAVLYWSMDIEGQVIMRKGFEEVINQFNKRSDIKEHNRIKVIPYVAGNGKEGILNQKKQFRKVIMDRVDLIVIQPTDNTVLVPELKLANKEKIPVIAYDQYILSGELLSFVTSDNFQAGVLNGEYVSSHFPNNKKIKIVLVEYPAVSSTIERVDGFFYALKKAGQAFEVVKSYRAVEPKSGEKVGKQMLEDFPEKGSFDVLFTVNDGGGINVVAELAKAKRFEIVGASVDGDPVSVQNIKNNIITKIDTAQFCAEIGRQSAREVVNYFEKRKVASKVLIPTFPITKETMSLYPGWMGTIPSAFKKPWHLNSFWEGIIKR